MAEIRIKKDKCKGCMLCIGACPKGLIKPSAELNKKGATPVMFAGQPGECAGCCLCALVCPDCCITVFKDSI